MKETKVPEGGGEMKEGMPATARGAGNHCPDPPVPSTPGSLWAGLLFAGLVLVLCVPGCSTKAEKSRATRQEDVRTGLFRYMADAPLFTDCATGETFPVAMEQDYLALERAYLENRREPGGPLRVTLEGHYAARPAMEGDGLVTVLVVDRFFTVHPATDCPLPSRPAEG